MDQVFFKIEVLRLQRQNLAAAPAGAEKEQREQRVRIQRVLLDDRDILFIWWSAGFMGHAAGHLGVRHRVLVPEPVRIVDPIFIDPIQDGALVRDGLFSFAGKR